MGVPKTTLTFDEEEDAGAIGENPLYVPLVHTVPAATSTSPQQTQFPSPAFDEANEKNNDSSGTVEALLIALSNDSSIDKHQTVGEWIRDHPKSASSLSPEHVGSILSKVTFSLVQSSVAMALTTVPHLTCAHICAAVRACPYQKAQVAEIMAPMATDPDQKPTVLALIDYAFERQAVEQSFRSASP